MIKIIPSYYFKLDSSKIESSESESGTDDDDEYNPSSEDIDSSESEGNELEDTHLMENDYNVENESSESEKEVAPKIPVRKRTLKSSESVTPSVINNYVRYF